MCTPKLPFAEIWDIGENCSACLDNPVLNFGRKIIFHHKNGLTRNAAKKKFPTILRFKRKEIRLYKMELETFLIAQDIVFFSNKWKPHRSRILGHPDFKMSFFFL